MFLTFFLEEMADSNNVINFGGKTKQEKTDFVLDIIKKLTNFDPKSSTCDWSTARMPLNVPSIKVFGFIRNLNFPVICSRLTGKKTPSQVLQVIVNPNDVFYL